MKSVIALCLMMACLTGCASSQDEKAMNKDVVQLNKEIDQLSAELARLKAQQKETEKQISR